MHLLGSRSEEHSVAKRRNCGVGPCAQAFTRSVSSAIWRSWECEARVLERNHSALLSPNFSQDHYALALVQSQSGDAHAAIACADHARELSPFDPLLFAILATRAMALMRLGRMEQAADWAVRASSRPNAHKHISGLATHCLELAGRHDAAVAAAMALRREHPGYCVDDLLQAFRLADDVEGMIRRAARGVDLA